ncbi:hypothetical protein Sango_2059300 [Sesamum angolense]|uniref:RNase H type-1 domain-containing protein n=1 Tax=Sesamum angolense TaxID=2727404 RepID=A0AAE2BLP5_9LAMI|nr:hypothetical protein Sango_2059300 [Sesamum angolense]
MAQELVLSKEKAYDDSSCEVNLIEHNKANAALTNILAMEEDFWRQKTTCKWGDEGERNTKFFHSLVKKKRSRNKIHSICHGGQTITNSTEIKESAALFFQELLSNNTTLEEYNLDCVSQCVSLQDSEMLCVLPTKDKIKQAIFDMCPDSAAGPDGFSALFYQVRWIKPTGHGMKLNTDGASKGSTGLAGAGGIIRDARGHTIVAFQLVIHNLFCHGYGQNDRELEALSFRDIPCFWFSAADPVSALWLFLRFCISPVFAFLQLLLLLLLSLRFGCISVIKS